GDRVAGGKGAFRGAPPREPRRDDETREKRQGGRHGGQFPRRVAKEYPKNSGAGDPACTKNKKVHSSDCVGSKSACLPGKMSRKASHLKYTRLPSMPSRSRKSSMK